MNEQFLGQSFELGARLKRRSLPRKRLLSAQGTSPLLSSDPKPMAVAAQNLCLFYGRTPAFRSISLSLRAGQVNAIIGPSGCGKTSFLNCINRLYELDAQAAVTGKVLLDGQNIFDLEVWRLRRQVGMLFQRPSPFPLSIHANLDFPLKEHGYRHRAQRNELIEAGLKSVGLWNEVKDRLHSPALALSGGQQQRLCLARTLVLKPRVILMDEPCSALDPISSELIEELILQLRGEYTIIIVTHNLAQASRIADQVAMFWHRNGAGELIEYGSSQQIFNEPHHPLTQAYVTGKRG